MSDRYVCPIECGRCSVTEGIGDHFKIETNVDGNIKTGTDEKWEPAQPVFISAQTGQGKNYFIEHSLIPYVRNLNYRNGTRQRVLILSNRLALQLQIKHRLNGNDDSDDDAKIYHYKESVDVMTYQSVLHNEKSLKKRQKMAHARYIYVICDEAHFFTSDAMFNPYTCKILSTLVRLFHDAIRVYMSATPYDCLEYIIKEESNYEWLLNQTKPYHEQLSSTMVLYHFKRDFSYLDIKIYAEFSELYEIIVKSVYQKKERWLFFIDDKEKSAKIKEQLLGCAAEYADQNGAKLKAGMVLAVDADSKKDDVYMKIVSNEELGKDTYVLIATSVLDNGVNLNNINNIVVSDMSKIKCLQMVGRAWVSDPNDRKTLYLRRFGSGYVDDRITAFRKQQDAYHRYDLAYGEMRDIMQSRGRSEYQFLNKYYNGNVKD